MQAANPYIFKIKPYVGGKPIEEVKRQLGLEKVFKLASNENPYPPSPKVLAAMVKAARDVNRYPDGNCYLLHRAVASALNIDENQLIFGNGSDEILVLAIKAFVAQGDEVIIAKPSFLVYEIASVLAGACLHQVHQKDFCYDVPAMKEKISPRTKIIFIGNPDNPTGTYITHDQAEDLLKTVAESTMVVFDEAYCEFVDSKDYPDTLSLMKKYPNVIVTRTFSKFYGLAGLRIGYGIASREVIDVLNRLREPFNVNSIAQAAAIAALKDKGYYRKILQETKKQKQYLYDAFKDLGTSYKESFTNFILVHVNRDSSDAAQALLKKGIIVRDMTAWGLKGYIRVTVGKPSENKQFIKVFKEIFKEIWKAT